MAEEKTSLVAKWLKGVIWTGLVLGVAYVGIHGYARAKVLQAEGALLTAGRPMSIKEMNEGRAFEGENADDVFRQALASIQRKLLNPHSGLYSGGLNTSGEWVRINTPQLADTDVGPLAGGNPLIDFYERWGLEKDFRDFARASNLPRKPLEESHPLGLDDDGYNSMVVFSDLSLVITYLKQLSFEQVAADKKRDAWRYVETALQLLPFCRTFDHDFNLAGQRVGNTLFVLDWVCALAEECPPPLEVSDQIHTHVKRVEDLSPYIDFLDEQRIREYTLIDQALVHEILLDQKDRQLYERFAVIRDLDNAEFLNRYRRTIERLNTPPYLWRGSTLPNPKSTPDVYLRCRWSNWDGNAYCEDIYRMIAYARVVRVVLDVLQHRAEHGEFPEDLASVGKEEVVDPFSGKPLIYRRKGEGCEVYSVGLNQSDDLGADDDIVWTYP